MHSIANLSNLLPSRRYALPDKAVASQVLMYRQLLHTECKPGLRLSRNYEGTDAQKKVKHMPWWESGVETSRKMVISYDNLIVRLWLGGAIMPYVDGGYAEAHANVSVPKDDIESTEAAKKEETKKDTEGKEGHIDTLIDSKGLPPIPHAYWVDRLGFQQTDPQTDFRSGGVLSLALMLHVVEACPNLHVRFLPSGDAHMLPFGITCINITDMIAKFCMFSKSVDRMDALLSQKPFWKMFENPDALLVLQELSMEILCNVVVEIGRERKWPKEDKDKNGDGFQGQDSQTEVTVFDFAEILYKTEKRVNDDLLGAGPRTVDELRSIHSMNCTKYMKAIEKKEQQAMKAFERSQNPGASNDLGIDKLGAIAASSEAAKNIEKVANDVLGKTGDVTKNVIGNAGNMLENAGKSANSLFGNAGKVSGNVMENAGGMFNKFKEFSMRPNTPGKHAKDVEKPDLEEVDFAKAPESENVVDTKESPQSPVEAKSTSPAAAPATESSKSALDEAEDLLSFLDDDIDVDMKTEQAKKEFEDLLGSSTPAKASTDNFFTIDDDDFL